MRQILFRGKRIDNGEWVYGWYSKGIHGYYPKEVTQIHTQTVYRDGTMQTNNAVDPNTVGQYTGLKDINGTMIYEGDIITDSNYFYDNSAPVLWNDVEAQFIADYEEEPMNIWPGCKVIGNIHDKED